MRPVVVVSTDGTIRRYACFKIEGKIVVKATHEAVFDPEGPLSLETGVGAFRANPAPSFRLSDVPDKYLPEEMFR